MQTIVTLAERQRQKLDAMRAAVPRIDAGLRAWAAARGGRFIRFGSSATGEMRPSSDIDILADFPDDHVAVEGCRIADELCHAHGLTPDSRPTAWASEKLLVRALHEGIVLA